MQREANIGPSGEMGLAEVITGVITSPTATMREISREKALRLAVPTFFLAALVTNVAAVLTEAELAQLLGGPGGALLVLTAFSIFYLLSQSGLCYSLARLFGCQGSFTTLISLLALTNVPSLFSAPLALLRFVPGLTGSFLHGLGTFALAVWVVALGVLAVRETFQLPTGRAVIVFFLPLFLVLLLAVVIILAAALT